MANRTKPLDLRFVLFFVIGIAVGTAASAYSAALYASDATIHLRFDGELEFDEFYIPPTDLYYVATEEGQELRSVETSVKKVTLIFSSAQANFTWADIFIYNYNYASLGYDTPTMFSDLDLWEVTLPVAEPTYNVSLDWSFKLPRGLYLSGIILTLTTRTTDEDHPAYGWNTSLSLDFIADVNYLLGYDSLFVDVDSLLSDEEDFVSFGVDVFPYVYSDTNNDYGHYLDYEWFREQCEDLQLPELVVNVTSAFTLSDLVNTEYLEL